MLRLLALGGLRLDLDRTRLTAPRLRPRVLALLALLVGHGARGLSRDKVVACLWPESDTAHARNSLKQAIFALRQNLGHQVVLSCPGGLCLDPALVESDVWQFEAELAAQRPEAAAALYHGPYLDGFYVSGLGEFERWAEDERQRLHLAFEHAVLALARKAADEQRWEDAVTWYRRLALSDPLGSTAALELMHALLAAGDPTGALEHFRVHAERVMASLNSPPAEDLVRYADQVRSGLILSAGSASWKEPSEAAPTLPPARTGLDAASTRPAARVRRWRSLDLEKT